MAVEPNRCPTCGMVQPAKTPEETFGPSQTHLAKNDKTLDVTTQGGTTSRHSAEASVGDIDSNAGVIDANTGAIDTTGVHSARPATSAVGITGDWISDPNKTSNGSPASTDLTRDTIVHYFGDYEIQKELGRGGMGVVYKARQITINRLIALKMIKAGVLANDAELRRFQNEAEAVALLDHVGIVPIYEVGEHEGQRYFSMKLVEGGNLADQLTSFQGNPRAAATLLAEMATALHHAHMRGVLHRDLKPANILISADGHPHITDFGLAKRVEADVELTNSGAILGTPAYMSPEQAEGRRGTITTTTDVYGLGAILYALLTGKAPFGRDSLIETLQAVKAQPPVPPRRLDPTIPRDLETICLKCLEKDPRRRYASAQALAEDLRSWLESRPVAARRVGTPERAWLWCKRNPVVAALTAAVVVAVIGGTTGIFVVQARANADLRLSNSKLDRAIIELKSTNTQLDQQRARAEDREKLAIDSVKKFRDAVAENPELKDNASLESLRKTLLKQPLAFFGALQASLAADGDTKPESLTRLADATFELGSLTNEIGNKEDALRAHQEALALRKKLTDAHPGVTEFLVGLGSSYNIIGAIQSSTGRKADAMVSNLKSLEVFQKLAEGHPEDPKFEDSLAASHNNIAILQWGTGKLAEAMMSYQQALAINQKIVDAHPDETEFQSDLATIHNNIGFFQHRTGKPVEALEPYRQALKIYQKQVEDHPKAPGFRSNLANLHNNIALLRLDIGQPAEALESLSEALRIRKELVKDHPTVTSYLSSLADSHNVMGILQANRGKSPEAFESFRQARELYQKLTDEHPTTTEYPNKLANNLTNTGWRLLRNGKLAEALTIFSREEAIWTRLVQDHPSAHLYRDNLANCLNNTATALLRLGKHAQARALCDRAIRLRETLLKEDSGTAGYRVGLAESHLRSGQAREGEGDHSGATADWRKANELLEAIAASDPETIFLHAGCHAMLSGAAGRPGSGVSPDEGDAGAARAVAMLRRVAAMGYDDPLTYQNETTLDPLRHRPDFRLMMMDLTFPTDPFTQ